MKNFVRRFKPHILLLFAFVELAIYVCFLAIQLSTGGDPIALKYSGVLLCLLTAAVLSPACGKDGIILTFALAFTALSDLFLFVLNDNYEVGVCTFIVAQILYTSRIYLARGKKPWVSVAVRTAISGTAILVLGITGNLNLLTALVAIYFPQLACNAAESAFLLKISKSYIFFFVGLVLFIGCDVCVGLNNFASLGMEISQGLRDFVSVAMWAFYLPSQTLIVASARENAA